MEKVISNLREKSILDQKQVMNIKKYISDKYRSEEASRKAAIFADAVHNIVDESVKKFEKQHRLEIRAEVLKAAIAKDIFDINGYDVFEVCSLLPIEDDNDAVKEQFFHNLNEWLNENQDERVSLEDTKALTTQIIDAAVFAIINLLEESILLEPGIKALAKVQSVKVDLKLEENDNPDLEDYITDGRFMDVEGDIVELTASDIEKAIIDSKNLYGDLDDIEVDEQIDKNIIRNEMNKRISLEEQDEIAKHAIESISGHKLDEEEVFDSMDYFLKESMEENNWTQANIKQERRVKTTRLSGYELKPPEPGNGSSGVTFRIKLIIIIPAIIVTLALIIFLILGAIGVSKRNVQLENELKQMQVSMISETIPNSLSTSNNVMGKADEIEGVNYNEGNHLADILKYKSINPQRLKEYLQGKNSLLSEDYYINVFIQVAKDYNVNPLLLVAITGQEQNFVQRDHPDVELMKNNPFNVYSSWKNYNTSFEDSCKIAARTVLTSSEERPEEMDPIKWINVTYAEDKNWNKGVTYFFNELMDLIMDTEL